MMSGMGRLLAALPLDEASFAFARVLEVCFDTLRVLVAEHHSHGSATVAAICDNACSLIRGEDFVVACICAHALGGLILLPAHKNVAGYSSS